MNSEKNAKTEEKPRDFTPKFDKSMPEVEMKERETKKEVKAAPVTEVKKAENGEKKTGRTVGIIIACLLIAGAIGFAIWYFGMGGKNTISGDRTDVLKIIAGETEEQVKNGERPEEYKEMLAAADDMYGGSCWKLRSTFSLSSFVGSDTDLFVEGLNACQADITKLKEGLEKLKGNKYLSGASGEVKTKWDAAKEKMEEMLPKFENMIQDYAKLHNVVLGLSRADYSEYEYKKEDVMNIVAEVKDATAEEVRKFGEVMGEKLWTLSESYYTRVKAFDDYVATGMEGDTAAIVEAFNNADAKYYEEVNSYYDVYDSYMPSKFVNTNEIYGTDFGESEVEIRLVELVYAIEKEIRGE